VSDSETFLDSEKQTQDTSLSEAIIANQVTLSCQDADSAPKQGKLYKSLKIIQNTEINGKKTLLDLVFHLVLPTQKSNRNKIIINNSIHNQFRGRRLHQI